MDDNRYSVSGDAAASENDSHGIIVTRLRQFGAQRVLDIGCSDGYLGRSIDESCETWGIELDRTTAARAADHYHKVIIGDAGDPATLSQLPDGYFDAVVCGDILEHLIDPWSFVASVRHKLRAGGLLLVSVPNLGHSASLASIAGDRFTYRDTGLHDRTHLRFFSIRSMVELLLTADVTPTDLSRTTHGLFETEIPVPADVIGDDLAEKLSQLPEGLTYQYIFSAVNTPPAHDAAHYTSTFVPQRAHAPSIGDQLEKLREELRDTKDYLNRRETEWQGLVAGTAPFRPAGVGMDASTESRLARSISRRIDSLAAQDRGYGTGLDPLEPCRFTYDIIIPVFNAPLRTKWCIESVLEHTSPRHNVIVIDDCSSDPAMEEILRGLATDRRITLVRNRANAGFVATVNQGLSHTGNDKVILNSDTVVTRGWLERMERCRLARRNTAIVTPLSNRATIYSVPEMNHDNDLPKGWSAQDMADLVAACSERLYPLMPTGVGFCMMITSELLGKVGLLDTAFGRGYGEENDLCQRAWQAGYTVACCDDAFVEHHGKASFGDGDEIGEHRQQNERLLAARWPNYHEAVERFCRLNPLRALQEKIGCAIRRRPGDRRPGVCHVIHALDSTGGTELHTKSIILGTSEAVRSTALFPAPTEHWTDIVSAATSNDIRICTVNARNCRGSEMVGEFTSNLMNDLSEGTLMRFLRGNDCEIVHIHHQLNWSTMLLALVAKRAGKKVVYSVHDYHLLCPEFNLVTPELKPCGRSIIDPSDSECLSCLAAKRRTSELSPETGAYAEARRVIAGMTAAAVDLFIAPSLVAARHVATAFGDQARIRIVPHGIKPPKGTAGRRGDLGGTFRIGFIGNLTRRKGADILRAAAWRLTEKDVAFEIFGSVAHECNNGFPSNVSLHGSYTVEELPGLLAGCDAVIIPSIWDETFCLTLSEAMSIGVPVIAARIGALAERVQHGKNGFLYRHDDPSDLAELINWLSSNRHENERCAETLKRGCMRSMADNCRDYEAIYLELATPAASADSYLTGLLAGDGTTGDTCSRTPHATPQDEAWLREAVRTGLKGMRTALAKLLAAEGRIAEARHEYAEAAAELPGRIEPLLGLGVCALFSGDSAAAVEAAEKATRLYPDDPDAAALLGNALRAAGRDSDALEALDSALRLDPSHANALATLLGTAGATPARLVDHCSRYLGLRPGDVEIRLQRARLLATLGELPAAWSDVEAVLALDPDNQIAASLRANGWDQ